VPRAGEGALTTPAGGTVNYFTTLESNPAGFIKVRDVECL
jgi:hypothetical protein